MMMVNWRHADKPVEVVMISVVTSERYIGTDSDAIREQDLSAGRDPDLCLQESTPVGLHIEEYAIDRTLQSDSTDEQNEQDDVRECGSEPDDLATLVQTLPDHAIDQKPSDGQTYEKFPSNTSDVVNAVRYIQHSIPENIHNVYVTNDLDNGDWLPGQTIDELNYIYIYIESNLFEHIIETNGRFCRSSLS